MTPANSHAEIVAKYTELLNALLGRDDWQLTEKETSAPYTEKLPVGKWRLWVPNEFGPAPGQVNVPRGQLEIARFELYPMINCCGICVSTQAWVSDQFRGKGLGTLLNSFRIDVARHNGYGVLLCTDVVTNEPQRKVLKANGWKDIHQFVNPRTSNRVAISVINL